MLNKGRLKIFQYLYNMNIGIIPNIDRFYIYYKILYTYILIANT